MERADQHYAISRVIRAFLKQEKTSIEDDSKSEKPFSSADDIDQVRVVIRKYHRFID